MEKLPYGISDYERLIENDYYYIDKTQFIEKLENLPEPYLMFLRPRKFGKTLFTSTLLNYYDINAKEKFDRLFGKTYIGQNPTPLRNSYCVLKFNFSGVDTTTVETTINGFKNKVETSIYGFISDYNIDFVINSEQNAEEMLNSLFEAFRVQKQDKKIYVIIDEYDHFANELLGFHTEVFKDLVSKNGKVRKWYEILKEGTETIVDRIFITGVAPITLDSLTSGFNISKDITRDIRFNEMMGFTEEELKNMIREQGISETEQQEILPVMKKNYDGYRFSEEMGNRIYNSNMCLYFLNSYLVQNKIPNNLIDSNIASDYKKLGNMLKLCRGEQREEIIEKTISGEGIASEITDKFNPEKEFDEKDLISMLYYLGYLTIDGEKYGRPILKIPNNVMKELYSEYFLEALSKDTSYQVSESIYVQILDELTEFGKIDKLTEILHEYLKGLSNRDFQRFDEKYVKLIVYCIAKNLKIYNVKSEMELQRKYPDIVITPREKDKGYCSIMIEFKYLKKEEKDKLEQVQKEAREQVLEYAKTEEMQEIEKLHKYTVVCVVDEVYVEEVY